MSDLGVTPTGRIVSYFEGNEIARTDSLVQAALEGSVIAVVTDAGMPSVSDPGYRLVADAVAAGINVTIVPGPSAVLAALAISGLPVDRFCFEGFLPRKGGERSTRLAQLAAEPRTMVFFEAPHRIEASLRAMAESFGADRAAAVCRELTKTYEEVKRGGLGELAEWAAEGVRGEITVVVSGASESEQREASGLVTADDWVAAVAARETDGEDRKAAIGAVAKEAGVPRREVYAAVVAAKGSAPAP